MQIKTTGPDGIPSIILKTFESKLAPIFTKIFCMSHKSGIFPDSWKTANVLPIPNKVTNQTQPIAIIPIIAKVFELYINHNIKEFIEDYKIVDDRIRL